MVEQVHIVGDCEFVVAQHGVWVEGVYDTPEAAIAAASLAPSRLSSLWKSARPALLTLKEVKDG